MRNEVSLFDNVLLVCKILIESCNLLINTMFQSFYVNIHTLKQKKSRDIWILQMDMYPMNHKSIVNKMKTVYELFLKFSETYHDKRKQIWWDKDQMFRGKMKKGLGVQIYDIGQI